MKRTQLKRQAVATALRSTQMTPAKVVPLRGA